MAKPKNTCVLRAAMVWRARKLGYAVIEEIPGTLMLRIVHWRVRLTWRTADGGEMNHVRWSFSRVLLNPRWINMPAAYRQDGLEELSVEELSEQGIRRSTEGEYKMLIYQQLGDLYTLYRQLQHVNEHQNYSSVDWPALAIAKRIQQLIRKRRNIRGLLERQLSFFEGDQLAVRTCKGMAKSLGSYISDLQQTLMKDEPFARQARYAIVNIRLAIKHLCTNNPYRAERNINLAIAHLKDPVGEMDQLRGLGILWPHY